MEENEQVMIEAAREAGKKAYAPYSGFKVGACARGGSGRLYTGSNVENASYGAACCAERVAIFSAVAAGEREITHVAIATNDADTVTPCGICRQVMAEFGPHARVLCAGADGNVAIYDAADLLPHAFTLSTKDKEGCL